MAEAVGTMPTTPRYVSGRPTSTRTSRRSPRTASSLTTTTPKPSRLSTTSSPRPASAVRPGSRAPTATPSQYSNRRTAASAPEQLICTCARRNASAITGEYGTTDREADSETGQRSLIAPNCKYVVAAAGRRYVLEALRSAGSMSERARTMLPIRQRLLCWRRPKRPQ